MWNNAKAQGRFHTEHSLHFFLCGIRASEYAYCPVPFSVEWVYFALRGASNIHTSYFFQVNSATISCHLTHQEKDSLDFASVSKLEQGWREAGLLWKLCFLPEAVFITEQLRSQFPLLFQSTIKVTHVQASKSAAAFLFRKWQ